MESKIQEGTTKFFSSNKAFYNPRMEFSRDLSVLLAKTFQKKAGKKLVVADVLAGSGIRGLRYLKELPAKKAFLNDLNPNTAKLARKSIKLNKLNAGRLVLSRKDANAFLSMHKYDKFDLIDLDPFGSPSAFFDSSSRSISPKNGFFTATATDLGALSGSFPKAGKRKYGILTIKTPCFPELQARALIASSIQSFAKNSIALKPVFGHASEHFIKIYCITDAGRSKADEALKQLKYLLYCPECAEQAFYSLNELPNASCYCKKKKLQAGGPYFTGSLFDKEFLKTALKELPGMKLNSKERIQKDLLLALQEIETPLFFETHAIAQKHKTKLMPLEKIIQDLKARGFNASKTLFSPTGVKSDASLKDFLKAMKE